MIHRTSEASNAPNTHFFNHLYMTDLMTYTCQIMGRLLQKCNISWYYGANLVFSMHQFWNFLHFHSELKWKFDWCISISFKMKSGLWWHKFSYTVGTKLTARLRLIPCIKHLLLTASKTWIDVEHTLNESWHDVGWNMAHFVDVQHTFRSQ